MDGGRPTSLFYFCINSILLYFSISVLSVVIYLLFILYKLFIYFLIQVICYSCVNALENKSRSAWEQYLNVSSNISALKVAVVA